MATTCGCYGCTDTTARTDTRIIIFRPVWLIRHVLLLHLNPDRTREKVSYTTQRHTTYQLNEAVIRTAIMSVVNNAHFAQIWMQNTNTIHLLPTWIVRCLSTRSIGVECFFFDYFLFNRPYFKHSLFFSRNTM